MNKEKGVFLNYWKKREPSEKLGRLFAFVIFCLFVVFVFFYSYDLYRGNKYLTLLKFKINPEFIFVVNGNDKVIYYLPLNNAASKIYDLNMFKGKGSHDALEFAIDIAKENNYLLSDERKVELTVVSNNSSYVDMYESKVTSALSKKDSKIVTETVSATQEEINNFSKINISNVEEMSSKVFVKNDNKFEKCNYTNVSYESLAGNNKIINGINVSKKMYPNGNKNVVLINSSDVINGYLSISLAAKYDASILMVSTDSVSTDVLGEIERLNVSNVYIVGGTDVISTKVENILKDKFNVEIKRVSGSNRYTTAINVAKEIDKFSSIIVVPNANDVFDAAMLGGISAKYNMPLFYSDVKSVNKELKEYIKSNKNINNIYLSSGTFTSSFVTEIKSLGRNVEVISEKNKYSININGIDKFDNSFKNIVLVNNTIDGISASLLAAKNDNVLFYVGNNISEGHVSLLTGNVIENIYYFGNKQPFKELLFNVKKNNINHCDNNVENLLFSTKKAIFYVSHHDDVSLYYGQTITTAIDVLGKENVYVVLLTDGSSVKKTDVINNNINEYNRINNEKLTFMNAYDKEYRDALIELGVENIHFIETFDFNRFKDGAFNKSAKTYSANMETLKKFIKSYSSKYEDVTHFALTFLDAYDDHEALGNALTSLYYDTRIDDPSFENVYLIARSNEMIGPNRHVLPNNKAKKYTREDNISNMYSVVLKYNEGFDEMKKSFNKFGYYDNKDECVSEINIFGIGCSASYNQFNEINMRLNVNSESPLETVIHIPYKK